MPAGTGRSAGVMNIDEQKMWLNFLAELEKAQAMPEDQETRALFARRFRSELVLLSFWLNQMKVTGGDLHIAAAPPENCDLCGTNLAVSGLFIDGQVIDGRWSFMCMPCYDNQGIGIGWGIGQLYRLMPENDEGLRNWVAIAGSDPVPSGSKS
ncbi:MAG: hypothetical protein GY751_13565 [Bacteroidetes bacterium]|nr:hypothetical protein [Bacteroidota bacterium]